MKLFRIPKRSLRTSLVLGVTAMLLPWVMFVLMQGQLLFPRVIGAFENVVHKTGAEMRAVMNLQTLLLKAAMPPSDYLIHGDPAELQNFARLSHETEQGFEAVLSNYAGMPEQQGLVRMAREEWRNSRRIAEALLALPRPLGDTAAAQDMKRMDAHIYRAEEVLERIHGLTHRRSTAQLDQARAVVQEAGFLIAAVFSVALAMAAASGFGLARAILAPLRALEEGANRLGAGDLSHRVTVDGQDELQQLAGTFNAMAERLQKNQAILAELSEHDGLTGMYNHRTFYALLADEFARAQRFKRPVSLLMLDIDHFKRVNDTHGHLTGDAVLKGLGGLLGGEARAIDRVCRYGGEEIAIILPETGPDDAANVAERLRASVEAQTFDADSASIRITVSIGVASWPAHADGAEALVAAADMALYEAKQRGRNQAVRYEPALGQPAALR